MRTFFLIAVLFTTPCCGQSLLSGSLLVEVPVIVEAQPVTPAVVVTKAVTVEARPVGRWVNQRVCRMINGRRTCVIERVWVSSNVAGAVTGPQVAPSPVTVTRQRTVTRRRWFRWWR